MKNYTDYELELIDTLHWIITETIKLGFDYWTTSSQKVDFLHELKRIMI